MESNNKAIAYLRVGSRTQLRQYNSLQSQFEMIKDYATKNNLDLVEVFSDVVAVSGQRGLAEVLIYSRKVPDLKYVLVNRFDRISRDMATYHNFKSALARRGVEVKSVTEPYDNSARGQFMENLSVMLAQMDSQTRSERVKEGLRRKKAGKG